jgi:hypothetical protein
MIELGKKESVTGVSLTAINATKISGDDAYDFSIEVGFNPNLGMEEGIR